MKILRIRNWGVLFLLILIGCNGVERDERPNILFITTEGQAWEDTPEQTKMLIMPNLQKLAKEGLVFENHYCNAPLSTPAFYTIISGTYPHTHQMMDDGANWLPGNLPVLMEKLANIGYQTIGIGNMHFKPWERMAGFQLRITADGAGTVASDTLKKDDYSFYLKKQELSRWDYLKYQFSGEIPGVYNWPLNDTLAIDYFVGNQAVGLIQKKKFDQRKPWFMWVSFNGPDYPWDAPENYKNEYNEEVLPKARYCENELISKPYDQTIARYGNTSFLADTVDKYPEKRDEIIQQIKVAHYASLSMIDEQIGDILSKLKQYNKLDNTVIVITSIKGSQLGDHHIYQAGVSYERSAHVPLIIWAPKRFRKGRIDSFTSHVDLFPTFMDLANNSDDLILQGHSVLGQLKRGGYSSKHAFIEILNDYSIVTENYKMGLYTPYDEGELYNRKTDPDELFNLYYNKKYKTTVDSLTKTLLQNFPAMGDVLNLRREYPQPSRQIELHQGDQFFDNEVPYLSNKSMAITLRANLDSKASGPIITYCLDESQGFSLYLENGKLYFGIRKYGTDYTYTVNEEITSKRLDLSLSINDFGTLLIQSPAFTKDYQFITNWPLPNQEGHPNCHTKSIFAGTSAYGWSKPYGNLKKGVDLEGEILSALIVAGNTN